MRKVITIILLTVVTGFMYSQGLPPSPGSIAQINQPVANSGVMQEVVPLTTLEHAGLSVPIGLVYKGGGIKVSEVASYVGLGWSLSCGGVITRVVKGHPDESEYGYLEKASSIPTPTSSLSHAQMSEFNSGEWDGEADIFYFSFSGRSGAFFFDRNGNIKFLGDEKLDVTITYKYPNSPELRKIDDILIRDEYGILYEFFPDEGTSYDCQDYMGYCLDMVYKSTWNLAYITSADGNNKIRFQYGPQYITQKINLGPAYKYYGPNEWDYEEIENLVDMEYRAFSPTLITSPSFRVEFDYGNERGDLGYSGGSDPQSLESITISDADLNLIKKFEFTYSYANDVSSGIPDDGSAGGPGLYEYYRLILESVTESGSTTSSPPYRFYYYWDGKYLPNQVYSYSIDHWGYYNGASNSFILLPEVGFSDINYDPATFGDADRDPVLAYAQTGSLQKIKYPYGGTKEYIYELNEYYDSDSQEDKPGGGIRVHAVKMDDNNGNISTTYYSYQDINNTSISSGNLLSPVAYKVTRLADAILLSTNTLYPLLTSGGSYVDYRYVTAYNGATGKVVNEYYTSVDYPDQFEFFAGSFITSPINSGYYQFDLTQVLNNEWRRGTLKNTWVYDQSNKLLKKTTYTYDPTPPLYDNTTLNFPMGGNIQYEGTAFKFYRIRHSYKNKPEIITDEVWDPNSTWRRSENKTEYFYDSDNHYFPTRVIKDNGNGGKTLVKTKYLADYRNDAADDCSGSTTVSWLKSKNMIGLPIEQQVWEKGLSSSSYYLVSGTVKTYCESWGYNPPDSRRMLK